MFTLSVSVVASIDALDWSRTHLKLTPTSTLVLILMLTLTLSVNGAIEINIFLISVNASVNININADILVNASLSYVTLTFPTKWFLWQQMMAFTLHTQQAFKQDK